MITTISIINIIMNIVFIFGVYINFKMISSFGELIVKFVEKNQEFYKNQKHLVEKSNQLAIELKKINGITNELKRSLITIQESAKLLNTSQHIEKLQTEILKVASENSKLSTNITKLTSEVSKLSNVKIKRD